MDPLRAVYAEDALAEDDSRDTRTLSTGLSASMGEEVAEPAFGVMVVGDFETMASFKPLP